MLHLSCVCRMGQTPWALVDTVVHRRIVAATQDHTSSVPRINLPISRRDWHENEQGQYHYRQDYYEPTHLSLLCSSYPYRRTRIRFG